jgi:hypothetical protein
MADKNIEKGLVLWQEIAEQLNNIVEEDGTIEKDDARIWQNYLHKWGNVDWVRVLLVIEQLNEHHPEFFKSFHEDAYITAREILVKQAPSTERVMDRKANKRYAWKMIMTMREVWNAANGINLPFGTVSKRPKGPKPPNLFE